MLAWSDSHGLDPVSHRHQFQNSICMTMLFTCPHCKTIQHPKRKGWEEKDHANVPAGWEAHPNNACGVVLNSSEMQPLQNQPRLD